MVRVIMAANGSEIHGSSIHGPKPRPRQNHSGIT
jgi:hypothetical protein